MNVLLWIAQILLALLAVAGGLYKVFAFQVVPSIPSTSAFPRGGWAAIGVFEVVCAVLLVVPPAIRWLPDVTPVAAAALALESIVLAVIYARYSLAVAAANPLVYVVPMAVVAAFVAWGRYAIKG